MRKKFTKVDYAIENKDWKNCEKRSKINNFEKRISNKKKFRFLKTLEDYNLEFFFLNISLKNKS